MKIFRNLHFDFLVDCPHALHIPEQKDPVLEHERVDTTKHPTMHKTKTIDYIILLEGDVTLLLDEDEVRLKPFDVVVQRGTNHAWLNNGTDRLYLLQC